MSRSDFWFWGCVEGQKIIKKVIMLGRVPKRLGGQPGLAWCLLKRLAWCQIRIKNLFKGHYKTRTSIR